jgi:beta-glucoside operon transcriptional antiterminator
MIVQKVLNNSLVLSMDDDDREVIVMGKGIGFNSRPGDEIDPEKIEKLFVTQALARAAAISRRSPPSRTRSSKWPR